MKQSILKVYIGDTPQFDTVLRRSVPIGLNTAKLNTLVDSLMNTAITELKFRKVKAKTARIVMQSFTKDFPNNPVLSDLKTFKIQ